MGRLNKQMEQDITNKIKIIEDTIPKIVFGSGDQVSRMEEQIDLAVDLWTYHNEI